MSGFYFLNVGTDSFKPRNCFSLNDLPSLNLIYELPLLRTVVTHFTQEAFFSLFYFILLLFKIISDLQYCFSFGCTA